jgi:hypothetical protein
METRQLTIPQASFLLTIRSIVSFVVLILVLPAITHVLTKSFKMSVIRRDLWIARATGLAGVLGTLLIAFASTPDVLIIGASPNGHHFFLPISSN